MEISVGAVLEGTIKSITKFGAFVTLPGGLGTFDEFFDIVSQVKAGELDAKSAILNVGGYFDPLVEMLDRATATGLNSTDWRSNCDVFDSPEPLAAWLEA